MFAVRTFKGAQLDLEHYKGTTIREYEIEMLDDDCGAQDLSIYDSILIKIYSKRGGTELLSYDVKSGVINNFIYWTVPDTDFDDMPRLEYYQDCIGILANGQKDLLFFGVSNLL